MYNNNDDGSSSSNNNSNNNSNSRLKDLGQDGYGKNNHNMAGGPLSEPLAGIGMTSEICVCTHKNRSLHLIEANPTYQQRSWKKHVSVSVSVCISVSVSLSVTVNVSVSECECECECECA